MKNVFDKVVCDEFASRINNLSSNAKPSWGKMSAAQMLAHCSVTYEYLFEPTKYKKPSGFVKLMLKLFVKSLVVGDRPY